MSEYLNSPDTDSDKEDETANLAKLKKGVAKLSVGEKSKDGDVSNSNSNSGSNSTSTNNSSSNSNGGGGAVGSESVNSDNSSRSTKPEDILQRCATLKATGNDLFSKSEFEPALASYSEAVNLLKKNDLPKDALILLNRSATFLALKRYVPAMSDASQACDLDPDNWKAHWRKGLALMGMVQKKFRTKEAIDSFEACLKCSSLPVNKKADVTAELGKAQRRFQKQEAETPTADLSNCTPS